MWKSVVVWPKEVSTGNTDNISTDIHITEDQAKQVCDAIQKEGLGGERLIFPITTYTREII